MPGELGPTAILDRRSNAVSGNDQRSIGAANSSCGFPVPPPEVQLIAIASIRIDGDAQHRIAPDPNITEEYAALMRAGVRFPPISVRYDGADYWPSDGFQRLAAAKLADFLEINAEVRPGTREDARWDSYAANATHGLRRTPAETEKVIERALQHPKADGMSNVEIAKHLHISEPTVRRWRERLSSSRDEDSFREVVRNGVRYRVQTKKIGRNSSRRRAVSRRSLRCDLETMKQESAEVTCVLWTVIEKWVDGYCGASECVRAVERFLWGHRAEFVEPPTPPSTPAPAT